MHYIIMIMSIMNYLYNRTKKTTTAEYSDDTVGGLKKAIEGLIEEVKRP